VQGPSAPGGPAKYVVNGYVSGGFALIAWPAHYDATGIMTFLVGQDGVIHEKNLGRDTQAAVGGLQRFDPDPTWRKTDVEAAANP
jgi:hypothetical protein